MTVMVGVKKSIHNTRLLKIKQWKEQFRIYIYKS